MTDGTQQPAPPTTPAEAGARLTALRGDPAWGEKLFAGDVAATKEFHSLHELAAKGDDIDRAMAGISVGDITSTDAKVAAGTVDMLRQIGVPIRSSASTSKARESVPTKCETFSCGKSDRWPMLPLCKNFSPVTPRRGAS